MYGRGPMMGGHRGPMGGLFILPALMFGGWIVVAVLSSILSLVGAVIGGVFEGLGALASGAFSGSGLVIGIVIGLAAFWSFRNRNARKEESTGAVDSEEVDTEIIEPAACTYRTND